VRRCPVLWLLRMMAAALREMGREEFRTARRAARRYGYLCRIYFDDEKAHRRRCIRWADLNRHWRYGRHVGAHLMPSDSQRRPCFDYSREHYQWETANYSCYGPGDVFPTMSTYWPGHEWIKHHGRRFLIEWARPAPA